MMKIKAIAMACFVGVFASPVIMAPAHAFPVTCINCSTTLIQFLEFGRQLLQYEKQVQEYITQVKQWEIQVDMGRPLSGMQFDNALTLVRNLEGVMSAGSHLTYNVNNLQARFLQEYPTVTQTFTSLSQTGSVSQNPAAFWNSFFRDERAIRQSQDMSLQAMQTLRAQSLDLAQDQQRMNVTAAQLGASRGHQQSIQATAVYAQHSAQQLMKMRQGLTLLTQIAIQEQADRSRREANDRAASQKWMSQRPGRAAVTPIRASDY